MNDDNGRGDNPAVDATKPDGGGRIKMAAAVGIVGRNSDRWVVMAPGNGPASSMGS